MPNVMRPERREEIINGRLVGLAKGTRVPIVGPDSCSDPLYSVTFTLPRVVRRKEVNEAAVSAYLEALAMLVSSGDTNIRLINAVLRSNEDYSIYFYYSPPKEKQ